MPVMRARPAAIVVALVLAAVAFELARLRHGWTAAVTRDDATPSGPAPLPDGGPLPGLPPAPRTRVVLIDGLAAETARTLPAWSALCTRGTRLVVDVGFPTVSMPVEVALWSGLTQQQTGIVGHGEAALVPPLDARAIPAQVAGSWAVAENHGFLVRSLGFARTDAEDPAATPTDVPWEGAWQARARQAVASAAPLVFVHLLRVDTAGHRHGADSTEYRAAALEADGILAALVAADATARWFALSDHGHLPGGGHGGEERAVRQVESCIAGPGVPTRTGGPIHIVDVARAIADSTGATLPAASSGRPFGSALAAPLVDDAAVPTLALARGVLALILLALGLAASVISGRRWWLAPWWLVLGCGALVAVHGEPTLSTPMTYAAAGRAMYLTWLPALAVAAISTHLGARRTSLARAVLGQLALPVAALAAAITAAGGWPTLAGANLAPVVPRFTAWASALLLLVAHGLAAVGVAALVAAVRPRVYRSHDNP